MIRRAHAGDVPALYDLIRRLAEYERLLEQVALTPERLHEHLFGPRPFAEALVAEDEDGGGGGGQVIGFALFFHNYSTFLGRPGMYLEDLFVLPEHRGRGFGKALLREVARIAVERGCGRLEWSVLTWNEPAIRFYRGLGAVPLDDWKVFRFTGEALRRCGS